jgi:hypothetical protein
MKNFKLFLMMTLSVVSVQAAQKLSLEEQPRSASVFRDMDPTTSRNFARLQEFLDEQDHQALQTCDHAGMLSYIQQKRKDLVDPVIAKLHEHNIFVLGFLFTPQEAYQVITEEFIPGMYKARAKNFDQLLQVCNKVCGFETLEMAHVYAKLLLLHVLKAFGNNDELALQALKQRLE